MQFEVLLNNEHHPHDPPPILRDLGEGSLIVGFSLSPVAASILAGEAHAASVKSQLTIQSGILPQDDAWLEHLTRRLNRLWIPMTARIRFNNPHWYKGASHEWGSLILTICANVSLLQSKLAIRA
jgi:hypothetical protein